MGRERRCAHCGEKFLPDRCNRRHQKYSQAVPCKAASKKASQGKWLAKNPDEQVRNQVGRRVAKRVPQNKDELKAMLISALGQLQKRPAIPRASSGIRIANTRPYKFTFYIVSISQLHDKILVQEH